MIMDAIDYEVFGDDMQYVEVELDPGEAAVGEAVLPGGGVDPHGPQRTESAFFVLAMGIAVLASMIHGFFGETEIAFAASIIAFGGLQDFLMTGACCDARCASGHGLLSV